MAGAGAEGNLGACVGASRGRRNGQVAKRAGFGGTFGVMVQEHARRHAQQQHNEHYRNYYAPDWLSVRHL
jgi:hypothetical protein